MTTVATRPAADCVRLKLAVRGAVQGVGFRPFVFRLAGALGLAGWVRNSPQGVFIEVEGPRSALEQFLLRLERDKPPRSFIQSLEAVWLDGLGQDGFAIRASGTGGDKTALVLPDIAACPDCVREIFDPANRRYHYPFTNCTNCGPRFSLIEALPYDRAKTSMRIFKMCPACQAEYDDPRDRRFHAQPNACPVCGPRLEFWERGVHAASTFDACGASQLNPGLVEQSPRKRAEARAPVARDHDALLSAADAIRQGRIIAVKGVGGFHLMVDARNETAVRCLRERKHREEKPFALMCPTLESVKSVCEVSALEERLLRSPEAPIVLLRRQAQISNLKFHIAPAVAPNNPNLGVMLPSNPLHHLLMAELGFPVVATSGNLSDEPICTDEREALERLRGIADAFLVHNRPIVRHVDDSIVRVMLGREMVLRRARGYAPLPIHLKSEIRNPKSESVLAVGAHLKNSVALSVGEDVFLSQHIGDLETEQAHAAFERVAGDLPALYGAKPEVIAADLHPDYLSTKWAGQIAGTAPAERSGGAFGFESPNEPAPRAVSRFACHRGPKLIQVQHHIAHVLACMAENELAPPVLGVAWDGTGYGTDATIWGGEFFLVTDEEVKRIAHLRPFRLPGGDAAVREPRRAALGLLYELAGRDPDDLSRTRHSIRSQFLPRELAALETMLDRGLNCPLTSSVGRLFDAVASLIGLRPTMRFEGQAAMELEFALAGIETDAAYELAIGNRQSAIELDWAPMIEAILDDVKRGQTAGRISARFHNAMVEAIIAVAKQAGESRVALSGGCFQNRYLTERTVTRLREEGFQPYWHQRVPPNDGGIALGQIVAARRELARRSAAFTPLQPANDMPLPIPHVSRPSTVKRAEARAPSSNPQPATR
jgi:hydrogenase maturation protein HypF